MVSHFAAPERADQTVVLHQAQLLCDSPLVSELLGLVSGLVAVINEHRQLVALNRKLLDLLDVPDAAELLGLRLGEAVGCIHAHEMDAGCGTSEYCATCGAVIAMVLSQEQDRPVERECILEAMRHGREVHMVLRVQTQPMPIDGRRFTLLFLQDRTSEHQQAILERVFLHDLTNLVSGIQAASQLLIWDNQEDGESIKYQVAGYADRLAGEIAMHRMLLDGDSWTYTPQFKHVALSEIVEGLQNSLCHHPATSGKRIQWPQPLPLGEILTDQVALLRVLTNMLINALEASEPGEVVRVSIKQGDTLMIQVWNSAVISELHQRRIFQRNFSTKTGHGRGIGTYAMKFLSERVLHGRVEFSSNLHQGTVFTVSLPHAPDAAPSM